MRPLARSQPGPSADAALADLIDEVAACIQEGETFDLEQWLELLPELAGQARSLLPAVQLLADLSRSGPGELVGLSDLTGPETSGSAPVLGTLGDFRLHREIGRGGMGVVYEAEQLSLGRRVALKVLPFATMFDPRQLQRFQNEARAAAGLEHPHIVPVHGVGCERGVHYYAMRYIDGQTLAALIAQRRQAAGRPDPLSPEDPTPDNAALSTSGAVHGGLCRAAALLGKQVAEALHHAHELGVIHRDVKPSNLLVDDRGQAWVTDFGLAHLEVGAALTRTGDLVGTLRYMAPEQASGQKALVDRRADVYGLGVTLYELLTLHPAFPATARAELLSQVIASEPPAPRRLDPSLPANLETIVLKAMAREPEARYTTAQEMADDLGRFVNGEPIHARPAGRLERLGRWCRRHPSRAALVAVTTLAVLTILPGALWLFTALKLADAERRARREAEKARTEAVKAETVARYYSLMDRARRRSKDHRLGWTRRGLADLRDAARLNFPGRDLVELRSEMARCLAGVDLGQPEVLLEDFMCSTLAFSPDGRYLAVAQYKEWDLDEGVVVLFDWPARKELHRLRFPLHWDPEKAPGGADGGSALAFSPDGARLALGTRSGWILIWDLTDLDADPFQWKAEPERISWLAFGQGGKDLYANTKSGTLSRADLEGQVQARLARGVFYSHPALHRERLAGSWQNRLHLLDSYSLEPTHQSFPLVVGNCCFSPFGRLLAVEETGQVRLLDPRNGTVIRTLADPRLGRAHEVACTLRFSTDGSLLITACGNGRDRSVKLWEVASGQLLTTLLPGTYGPLAFALSPDGRSLVVTADKQVVVYTIGGLVEQTFLAQHTQPLSAVRFSPCGQFLACLGREHPETGGPGVVSLWRVANGWLSGRRERPVMASRQKLAPLAFHPKGAALASCGWRTGIDLWDLAEGRQQPIELGPRPPGIRPTQRQPLALSFSPDGRYLWAGLNLEGVRSWDWSAGTDHVRWRLERAADDPTPSSIYAVASGQRWVLAGGQDGAAYLLRADGKVQRKWYEREVPVRCLALSRDEKLAAWGNQAGQVRVARTDTGEVLSRLEDHQDAVSALAFGPSGNLLVTGSRDATVRLYQRDGNAFMPLLTLRSPAGPVQDLDLSPDGRKLALVIRQESAVRLWHLDRLRERLARMKLDPDWPAFVDDSPSGEKDDPRYAFFPEQAVLRGERLCLAGKRVEGLHWLAHGLGMAEGKDPALEHFARGALGGWCRPSNPHFVKKIHLPCQGKGAVMRGNAYSPDGKFLALSPGNDRIHLLDARTGLSLWEYQLKERSGPLLTFSPDSKILAALFQNPHSKTLQFWSVSEGKRLREINGIGDRLHDIGLAFSPDGERVVAGDGERGTARRWEVDSGREIEPSLPHTGTHVIGLAFSPDSKTIATGCADGTTHLWDAATGKHRGIRLRHGSVVWTVAFSPDGKRIAIGCIDGTTHLWDAVTGKRLEGLRETLTGEVGEPRHGYPVFSPCGAILVTHTRGNTVRLWDVATRMPLGPPMRHTDWVNETLFSADGRTLATFSRDGLAMIWEVPQPLQGSAERITCWLQAVTGREWTREGHLRVLDEQTLKQRRQRLTTLGGPPRCGGRVLSLSAKALFPNKERALERLGKYRPLSLEKVATVVSTRGLFEDEDSRAEQLVFADWKPKTVEGVPFVLVNPQGDRNKNAILLYGPRGRVPPRMPRSVSLPCEARAKAIHLLSGVSGWGHPHGSRGSVSLIVRLHYADGKTEDHELKNGEHFADYFRRVDVPGSKFAFDLRGKQVRYLSVLPLRSEKIEQIEFVKGPDATAPLVMAVTLETPG